MAKDRKELWRAVKFAIISSSAGIIDASSFLILNSILGTDQVAISQMISLILSVIWNFTINRKVTFKAADNVFKSMLLIALFYLVFTPVSMWFTVWITDMGLSEIIAKAITMIANLVLEYLFARFVVYRNSCDTAEQK